MKEGGEVDRADPTVVKSRLSNLPLLQAHEIPPGCHRPDFGHGLAICPPSLRRDALGALGVTDLVELYVDERADSGDPEVLARLDGAAGVFFTGGDQLRISSQIGDTALEHRIRGLHQKGGIIAGTSAGAAVMSETMLVKGPGSESYRIGEVHMAPGLGLIQDVIIDQHFAERGRYGRLLGAVAHNPRLLGVGIDEDTALLVQDGSGEVVGAGAVYVVDGETATHSNIAEARSEDALSMFDVRMHVLAHGDRFEFTARRPVRAASESAP